MLIEAPLEVIDEHVQLARDIMAQACRDVLGGKPCRIDAEVIRAPNRYMDTKRGVGMWDTVMRCVGLPTFGGTE